MEVWLHGHCYSFRTDCRVDAPARHAFASLAGQIFGLPIEQWHQNGDWGEDYIPYVLFDGPRAVANVAVNRMEFLWRGRRRRYIQLGTVMTDPAYRGRGLARWLMEAVLREWTGACDTLYLFANDSVLDFYPKFGFVQAQEQQAVLPLQRAGGETRGLHMENAADRTLLLEYFGRPSVFSAFPMAGNPGLLLFTASFFLRDCFFLCPQVGAVVVAEHAEGALLCHDIFGGEGHTLEEVLACAALPGEKEARLGFTPQTPGAGKFIPYQEEDTTLFLLKGKENLFAQGPLLFPLLSHA